MDCGNVAVADGNLEAAIESYSRAVQLSQTDTGAPTAETPIALKSLANVLTLAGQHAEAADIYRRLVTLDPADRTNRFNLAVARTRQRLFHQAEETYLQLLADYPDFVQARYNLAALYQAVGKLTLARRQWEEVVRQAPHLSSAHAALGSVLLDLGQADKAAQTYAEAVRLAPDDPAMWGGLARAARASGNLGWAASAARRAAELAEQDAATWRLLGDILLELHRASGERQHFTDARQAWRRSLALDASQTDLRRLLGPESSGAPTSREAAVPATQAVIDN